MSLATPAKKATPAGVPTTAKPAAAAKVTKATSATRPSKAPAAVKAAKPSVKVAKAGKVDKADKAPKVTKAVKPAPAATAANKSSKKPKLIRDSFTMPDADFKLIAAVKQRALGFQKAVKKSEVLRAGLKALQGLSEPQLKALLETLPVLKTGRPKKAG